jgi:hypothetical protein
MATLRQKAVVKKIAEDHRKSVSQAMREAGYSKQTATKPSNLTSSKGWKELMDKFLPDSLLAKKHKELLTIKTKKRSFKKGELEWETEELNTDAIARALDMGYKLKGKYKPTQVDLRSFIGWTPQELDDYAAAGVIPDRFIDAGEGES